MGSVRKQAVFHLWLLQPKSLKLFLSDQNFRPFLSMPILDERAVMKFSRLTMKNYPIVLNKVNFKKIFIFNNIL